MPLRIFYLDDERELVDIFVELFSGPDREIVVFTDPSKAIQAAQEDAPDIFFIDYRLPNLTGDQVAQRLDPRLPKILVTGEIDVKVTYKFMNILEKPYKVYVIEAILNQFGKSKKTIAC